MKNKNIDCEPLEKAEAKAKRPIIKRWWFYVIVAIVLIAAIGSFSGRKKSEKIHWKMSS